MKLTTDYDRDQQNAFRRRNRMAQSQAMSEKCPCEVLSERILAGESPAQLHRWALHSQPPKFLRDLRSCLTPGGATSSSSLGGHFSQSATQLVQAGSATMAGGTGRFGHHSFDSLERSKLGPRTGNNNGGCCDHVPLFSALVGAEKGGGLFSLLSQSWAIPLSSMRDNRGQGLLHWAVQKQLLNVQELLQLLPREQVLAPGGGVTPLHLAAAHRSPRILRLLLDALKGIKEDVHACQDQDGMTPLHHAAAAGSEQCCELLVGPGWQMPVDLRDNFGRTPLHLTAWNRRGAGVARLLMSKKITATVRDNQGWTPLHTAVMANNGPVLEALLEALAPTGAAQVFDHDSRTPLHYAALYDQAALARLLTQAGASNDTRDRFNVTAAHYAAQCASHETLVAVLGQSAEREPVDNEGRTPFMWAVVGQNLALVQRMLADKREAAQLLASEDHFKRTCLHLAALGGGLEMCKLLLDGQSHNGALSNADQCGATAEHLAAGQGNSELVLWFGYQRGHLPQPLDEMDRTPFFHACLGGQFLTVETMLRSLHINPDHLDNLGRSALHCAVISESLNCVKVLMESKLQFDPHLLDNNSKTALDIAKEQKNQEMFNYLEENQLLTGGSGEK